MDGNAIRNANATGWAKFRIWTPQQLHTQNGEHKSFEVSCECPADFAVVSFLSVREISPSMQGLHASRMIYIDNMTVRNFTSVKLEIKLRQWLLAK